MKAAAAVLALLVFPMQETDPKPCDVARAETRDYCAGCKRWPPAGQIHKNACTRCRSRIERVETCIKVYWDCPKAHDAPRRHAKPCGVTATCCTERPSLAIVEYVCGDCRAKARKAAEVRHKSETCAGGIKKTCTESGTFPHGGSE